ncbi:MAG: TetR/AcrR family transcriptional regulator [Acidimicrobiia bacterium]
MSDQALSEQRSTTEKGLARREAILEAATTLFYQHGYHATGIDDIGRRAGITGPGIYRHFDGKDAILVTIFDRLWRRLESTIAESQALEPRAGLDLLISNHVNLVVDRRAEVVLLLNDLRSLPADYLALAQENDAVYQRAWAGHIGAIHTALTSDEASVGARSAIWLITAYDQGAGPQDLDPVRAKGLLTTMANAAVDSLA